jgi:FKBP12-rapamycin complex-associated protein
MKCLELNGNYDIFVQVINRVESKLRGTDFGEGILKVESQVQKLIEQATSHENLAQLYIGWSV